MNLKFKSLSDGSLQIEGVGIPFGGPVAGKDLHGQFFSKKTDFAWDLIPDGSRPLLYQHGLDDTLNTNVIGRWSVKKIDDKGVWVQAQLDARNEYLEEIKELLDKDSLGLSSATMGHLVKVSGKSGEILRWPVIEMSLTPNPANPAAYVVKSAGTLTPRRYVEKLLAVKAEEVVASAPADPVAVVEEPAEDYGTLDSGLRDLLSDVIAFYLEAHGAHWNVVGDEFKQYHDLFGEIYEDVFDSIDPLAENIRKLGAAAPFSLKEVAADPALSNASGSVAAEDLCEELYASNSVLLMKILSCFNMATEADEQGIANFLADRQDMHKKWAWQLSASLDERGEQTEAEEAAEPAELEITPKSRKHLPGQHDQSDHNPNGGGGGDKPSGGSRGGGGLSRVHDNVQEKLGQVQESRALSGTDRSIIERIGEQLSNAVERFSESSDKETGSRTLRASVREMRDRARSYIGDSTASQQVASHLDEVLSAIEDSKSWEKGSAAQPGVRLAVKAGKTTERKSVDLVKLKEQVRAIAREAALKNLGRK